MNDLPRQTLSRIIARHGREICGTPKRVEAMLRDLSGAHRREINIIMGALEERVAADLIAAGSTVPRDVLFARLAARLRDNLAYTPEAARWGVETWAVALGVLSEAELQERARTESLEAKSSSAPPSVRDAQPLEANPANADSQATEPQRGTTHTPSQQPTHQPQMNPPPSARPPAPSRRRKSRLPSNIIVPEPPAQSIPTFSPGQTSRRGLTLRGCIIMVVLFIVLLAAAIFIVPAVIMVLREEQAQPSINDPRVR